MAAPFTTGNLVVCRVGDGLAALTNVATPFFLDEYTTAGVFVQSIAMPVVDSGAQQTLTVSGTATSECFVTRSANARYLIVAGYDAAVGTASVTSSASTAINRVIGRVDQNGIVDTTTALTDAISGGNPRSAVSTNGTDIWISGTSTAGGIRYTTFGSTTSVSLATTPTNLRVAGIFDGQLFVSANTGAFRLATVGTGTPTTAGQTLTNLPGFPTAAPSTPYGYFFADLSTAVAGVDTLYVADDTAGLQKYSLVAGNWTLNGTVAGAIRGLTGHQFATSVVLYGTSTVSSANTLASYVDTTGYNMRPSPFEITDRSDDLIPGAPTVIATAAANTVFRSVAFAPFDPTSAGVTVGGRIVDHTGRGIGRVAVTIVGGELTTPVRAITSPFGYYRFEDLTVGATYILTVDSKQYSFTPNSRIISLTDEVSDIDFTADAPSGSLFPSINRKR